MVYIADILGAFAKVLYCVANVFDHSSFVVEEYLGNPTIPLEIVTILTFLRFGLRKTVLGWICYAIYTGFEASPAAAHRLYYFFVLCGDLANLFSR